MGGNRSITILLLIAVIILSGSCNFYFIPSETKVSSYTDPAFNGQEFHRMLIAVQLADLDTKRNLEQAVSDQLAEYNISGIPSITLILPTRTYNANEISKILTENKIDSSLMIQLTNQRTITESLPSKNSTYVYSVPKLDFDIKLYDIRTDTIVWVSFATYKGSGKKLVRSLSTKIVDQMKTDGLLR